MKHHPRTLIFLLSLFLASTFCQGDIIETMTFTSLKDYISPQTLVILDIDNTLMIPVQELGTDQWFYHRIKNYEMQGLLRQQALEKALAEWTAIQSITKVRVVEEGTQEFLTGLQNAGYTIMGLTTRGLGLSHRTVEQLKSISIDLSITSPTKDEIHFMNSNEGILYRQGILFTAGTNKGEAFKKFIDIIQYPLQAVVFINDKATHIKEIETACQELGIPFIGLRYGYTDEQVRNFRQDISDIQWEHFGHILSDQIAEQLLLQPTLY